MGIGIKGKFAELANKTGELVEKAKPRPEQTAALKDTLKQAGNAVVAGVKIVADKARQQLETPAGKKVAAAAATGAALGVPLPIVGPVSGAVIGGFIALWLTQGERNARAELENRCKSMTPSEIQEELVKLEELRKRGDLSESQYQQLRRALGGH